VRVPLPISLASLQVADISDEARVPLDRGRGSLPLRIIFPAERQSLPASNEPSLIPSAASEAIPGGPSTSETSIPDPVRPEWSAPGIDPDEPGRRHSREASDEAVVFATLAAFALFVIRTATLWSEDSAEDASVAPFQAVGLLDSMSRSWPSKASAT
jgi:hypothetical protein